MKLIDVKNLTFEYFRRDDEGNLEEMIEALKDVSLDVQLGEFVAIVGRNGSGKSTLAKHINALLLPGEGQVIVDGMDTTEEELRLQIRKTAGMVFQNPDNQIVGNLVEEDVAFGPENLGVSVKGIWKRVKSALEMTDMETYHAASPNHLSGGQKQRVAIAGVLAMEPKCIIFDEATSMLDPQGREQLLFVAKQLQQEKRITILFVTHHMDEVMWADRVLVMDNGQVRAQGTPKQIFAQKSLLHECGLDLPVLYQYINFLIGQDILSAQETRDLKDESELDSLLCRKMVQEKSKEWIDLNQKTNYDNDALAFENAKVDIEKDRNDSSITEGILLNEVSYYYNKGFANETIGLEHVNLQIGKGEFIAIIGTTGSGKSTLVQHLNGLYFPMEGNVYYNGQDICDKDFPIKELRQKVGFVFQNPDYQLFAESVEKDVCFGPENMNISKVEAQKRAYEAIRAVGLPDTIYDVSPLQLSGGQKRRVAIAGVLAMQPEYMVLDEPTAGLDPVAAKELLDMLKRLQEDQGITIVMVSHNLEEVAEYAERVIVMQDGKIQMDEKTGNVFSQVAKLEQMGLRVPLGVKMLYRLKNAGLNVEPEKCKRMDICGELLRLKMV